MVLNLVVLAGLWFTGHLKDARRASLLALTNGVGPC
jgi:hypothetical protein